MNVHFIAIGGSAMHNMAIAMHKKGFTVTGSDDEIFEPSKSRLAAYGLLPVKMGWDQNNITSTLDAVILGMHARANNPELLKAKELGLKIYSYPEYIYEQTKDKTRVVIGGSHGKTTVTAMILHVLKEINIVCDYLVGAQLEGFETMVKFTKEAGVAVIEGDEYLSSPIDLRPKFHLYHPNVAILTGIAWDHINVFPTFENYVEQFRIFISLIKNNGTLVYCNEDENVRRLAREAKNHITKLAYSVPNHVIENGVTSLVLNEKSKVPLLVFGKHNLMNIEGARLVCNAIGVDDEKFYTAIGSFKGAARRLELVKKNNSTAIYKDFAHSPSKLKATTAAMKEQFPHRQLTACMELHTFSSLNENFLNEYKGSMDNSDEAYVYFNPHTIEHKKLKPITEEQVKVAFANNKLKVFTDSQKLCDELKKKKWENRNLLMMTSGNFDGVDFNELASQLISV